KLPNRRPDYHHDESENEYDENDQSEVVAEYKVSQTNEHARTLRADGMRHGRTDTNGRKFHDVVRQLEHHLRETFHSAQERFSFFANRRHRHREKHGEGDDLQNVAPHHRINDARGEYVHERFDQSLRMSFANFLEGLTRPRHKRDSQARLG